MKTDCRAIQEAWMAAFDEGAPEPPGVANHLAKCGECRGFAAAASGARAALEQFPAPEVDPAADLRLVAMLRAERRAPWWQALARRAAEAVAPRGLSLPLAGTGLASFAATLIVAGSFAALAGRQSPDVPGRPASPAGQLSREPQDHLEEWLSSPTPSVLIPRRPVPQPAPDRRRRPALRSRRSAPRLTA